MPDMTLENRSGILNLVRRLTELPGGVQRGALRMLDLDRTIQQNARQERRNPATYLRDQRYRRFLPKGYLPVQNMPHVIPADKKRKMNSEEVNT